MLIEQRINSTAFAATRAAFTATTAARAPVRSPAAPAVVQTPAPPTVPERGAGDLLADLRASLESDPDYQILRQTFALDAESSVSSGTVFAVASRNSAASRVRGGSQPALPSLDLRQSGSADSSTDSNATFQSVRLDASVTERLTVRFDLGAAGAAAEAPAAQADPLALDLSGAGVTTTGIAAGVRFDLDGDGTQEQVSFVTGGTWLLALDHDTNGRIDDGRELFGDQNGAAHGFAELSRYDDNGDRIIDVQDAVFGQLRLFQMNAAGEQTLQTLADAGVTAIGLGYQQVRRAIDAYDQVAQTGRFERADGTTGEAADLLLGYRRLA